jgi:hypothetical protein
MVKPKIKDDKQSKSYWLMEPSDTISCIELTMRHDKRGYVIGWMEGEPKTDSWDGSIDNQISVLEDKEPERRDRKLQELK